MKFYEVTKLAVSIKILKKFYKTFLIIQIENFSVVPTNKLSSHDDLRAHYEELSFT